MGKEDVIRRPKLTRMIRKRSELLQHYLPRPGARTRRPFDELPTSPEHMYNIMESAIVIISDSQILLGLALAVSFIVIDRCKTLQYHFMIGINLLLLATTSYLQSLAIVRRRRSLPGRLATILKTASVWFILYFIGWILVTQNAHRSKHPWAAERLPSSNRTDSVIFLKAACFLDPDFQKTAFLRTNTTMTVKHRYIGLDENTGNSPEWILWVMIVVTMSIVCSVRLLGSCCGRFWRKIKLTVDLPPPTNLTGGKWYDFVFWSFIWGLSFAAYIYVCMTVFPLRIWAFKSGWMKPNEMGENAENDITGFGQSAALFSIAAVVFAMLEQASENSERPSKRDEGNEYIQMA